MGNYLNPGTDAFGYSDTLIEIQMPGVERRGYNWQ